MNKRIRLFGLLGASLVICALLYDYSIYQANVASPSCCGYVAPEWYKRPITHLLVDWTKPQWRLNATKTEQWLVSDGLVNGSIQFWTVWESKAR